MVRLKVSRCDLAPDGNDKILPVVPPSQAITEYSIKKGIDPGHAPGPSDGGLFLRITGVFFVEGAARISGTLFDLVEEGLVDANVGDDGEQQEGTLASGAGSVYPVPPQAGGPDIPSVEPAYHELGPTPSDPQVLSGQHGRSWKPPEPPIGYKFRSILKGDQEAVVDLSLLSGRYYPRVLTKPLLSNHIDRLLRLGESVHYLHALEGLVPGYYNSVDPVFCQKSRQAMLAEAIAQAQSECEDWFDRLEISKLLDVGLVGAVSDVEMDVDEGGQ